MSKNGNILGNGGSVIDLKARADLAKIRADAEKGDPVAKAMLAALAMEKLPSGPGKPTIDLNATPRLPAPKGVRRPDQILEGFRVRDPDGQERQTYIDCYASSHPNNPVAESPFIAYRVIRDGQDQMLAAFPDAVMGRQYRHVPLLNGLVMKAIELLENVAGRGLEEVDAELRGEWLKAAKSVKAALEADLVSPAADPPRIIRPT